MKNEIIKRDLLDSSDAMTSIEIYNKMLKKNEKEKSKLLQSQNKTKKMEVVIVPEVEESNGGIVENNKTEIIENTIENDD